MKQKDDESLLAGTYSTSKGHSLIGRALGAADVADEFLHLPDPSGHYSSTETSYFNFNIPSHNINGEIYIWLHPILKTMSAGLYIWRGLKSSSLAAEYVNHHHYLPWPDSGIGDYTIDALKMRIKVIKPLESIEIVVDDADRGMRLSMRQDAIMPPAVRPGGFHFTQAMKATGELVLHGEKFDIDCFSSRDRSWGQERREDPLPIPPLSWMVGVFNEGFAFHALAFDDPALNPEWVQDYPGVVSGANLFWGYLWKDGLLTPLSAARKLTTRDDDGISPTRVEMAISDIEGREVILQGEVEACLPWQTWQNMNTFFCLTRWQCGTEVGFGDIQDVQFNSFTRKYAK